jgi:hypothetical protein
MVDHHHLETPAVFELDAFDWPFPLHAQQLRPVQNGIWIKRKPAFIRKFLLFRERGMKTNDKLF